MRSGTCRMLKLYTNVSVPFLIYAVIASTVYQAQNFNQRTKKKNLKNERGERKNKCIEFV